MEIESAMWDAINRYAISVGGDPSKHVYGNTPRQQAVADVSAIVARVTSRQQIDDIMIDELVKGSKKLKTDHSHLQQLYTESRDYVHALEGERNDLVAAARLHVVAEDRSDAEISRLRACLTEVRGFLHGVARRSELGSGAKDLVEEVELISRVLGEAS